MFWALGASQQPSLTKAPFRERTKSAAHHNPHKRNRIWVQVLLHPCSTGIPDSPMISELFRGIAIHWMSMSVTTAHLEGFRFPV
jgi:hypothetical protein